MARKIISSLQQANRSAFIHLFLFCFVELQSVTFTEEPANPTYVVEGNNIFLKWSHVFNGTLLRIQLTFVRAQGGSSLTILEYKTPNLAQFTNPSYTNQLGPVNITDTQSSITFLRANRVDSGTYQLEVVLLSGPRNSSSVVVEVQCKY